MTNQTFTETKAEAFADQMLSVLNSGMIAIGRNDTQSSAPQTISSMSR